ncbi:MAG: universal stress protein [Marinilabiliaceae bacterium]|jgi:nucleotide-binding universal stress UspA family protein|nr:universal stress protein [Marinilabiliaceae bacterium]
MKLLEKILVPVNLDTLINNHLDTAAKLADKFNSQLILVSVLPDEARKESIKIIINKHIKSSLSQIADSLRSKNLKVDTRILFGNTFDRIITTAENENVNLILVSNNDDNPGGRYNIDVVAEKLIRKSQKPVWVVKEGSRSFPEKILCSVDYSDASERALNNAIKIARTFKADLQIINVLETMDLRYSPRYKVDFEEENKRIELENEKKFNEFIGKFNFTDINYRTQILRGMPHKEILDFIAQNETDLLFMGATGKTFMQRILLGSVTEKVVRELPVSMLITKTENILNLKIDADISEIEKHMANAQKLEETGYYAEAAEQYKTALQINDLHIPALSALARLYDKIGEKELSELFYKKIDEILRRLWDRKIELEIRKSLKL